VLAAGPNIADIGADEGTDKNAEIVDYLAECKEDRMVGEVGDQTEVAAQKDGLGDLDDPDTADEQTAFEVELVEVVVYMVTMYAGH
jgi:hypothetical protein